MVARPRLTVLLPTYDSVTHVERAVESVLGQTFDDLELIVVDDGSTDGTREVVESFADERLRLLVREDRTGLPSALNRGIEAARGEYVARQDGDDYSAPERFERQVEYLDDHPSVAMIGTGARLLSETGTVVGRRRVLARPTFEDLLSRNHFVHGSVMMRRDALGAVGGYDEFFDISEDYDLWLRLRARYPLRNIDEPLYALRIREGSVYGSRLEASKLYARFAARRAGGDVPDGLRERIASDGIEALYEELSAAERYAYHRELGTELLRYRNRSRARRHCLKAATLSAARPKPYLLYALSFAPPSVVDRVVRLYRIGLNATIAYRNRRRDG